MAKKKPLHFSVGKSLLMGSAITMSMGAAGCPSEVILVNPGPSNNYNSWNNTPDDAGGDTTGEPDIHIFVNPGPWDDVGLDADAANEVDTRLEPEVSVNPGPWDDIGPEGDTTEGDTTEGDTSDGDASDGDTSDGDADAL